MVSILIRRNGCNTERITQMLQVDTDQMQSGYIRGYVGLGDVPVWQVVQMQHFEGLPIEGVEVAEQLVGHEPHTLLLRLSVWDGADQYYTATEWELAYLQAVVNGSLLATVAAPAQQQLTVTQAAELLGITSRTITQAISDGRLPAERIGGKHWLLRRADVEAYDVRRKPRPRRAE